jgi:hypothetical protein
VSEATGQAAHDAGAAGVTAGIEGDDGSSFAGAAVLRTRPHPATGEPALQLGVPDDALGFRPRLGVRYRIRVEHVDGRGAGYASEGAWLERVQSSWWFLLTPTG